MEVKSSDLLSGWSKEAWRNSWEFVVQNRLPAFVVAVLVPAVVAFIQFRWRSVEMKAALITAVWTLAVYFIICLVVYLVFLLYHVPRRRLVTAAEIIQQAENKIASLQKQLERKESERAEVVALRNLREHHFAGSKNILAEIIGFPGSRATNAQWDAIDSWWRSAVGMLGQKVLSPFLPPSDIADLDELEDNEARGHTICLRLTGDSTAAEERLTNCVRARLERVQQLIEKIEGKIRQPSPTPDKGASRH
jgi:hypothetical protein